MFWGLSIEGGKHYSQIVNETFNVTMAALETREFSGVDPKPTGLAQVVVRHDRTEFLLCSLQHGQLNQQPLNLCFSEGEEVTFFMEGKGMVHLSGYLRPSLNMDDGDMDYPSMSESESEESLGNTSDDNEDSITLQELAEAKMLLESEEEDEEEADWMPPGKRKKKTTLSKAIKVTEGPKKKKAKKASEVVEEDYDEKEDEDYKYEGSDEDEEEEEDDESDMELISFEAEEVSEDEESEEGEDDEEEEEEEVEEVQTKKTKQKKKGKNKKKESDKTVAVKSNESPKEKGSELKRKRIKPPTGDNKENIEREALAENKMTPKQKVKQSPKSEKKTPKNQVKSGDSSSPEKKSPKKQKTTPKKLEGGTTILDLKEGDGPIAKQGKRVSVYYKGVLASNQKQFDSCASGSGFPFRLGRGEVIKGWDVGIQGMKVGGKRKITIPPRQGYGSKRTGPIPPNSTLIFEVELKSVK